MRLVALLVALVRLGSVVGCAASDGDGAGDADGGGPGVEIDARAPGDAAAPACPHVGPPVINPASLPACDCAGAHCLPAQFIEPALASSLAPCAAVAGSLCVPDELIETAGNFVPATCRSLLDAEGRCLSICLPEIAAEIDRLPQSTCADGQRCAPCFDPTDGTDTGACTIACDEPVEPAVVFSACCHDDGQCVTPEAAGGDAADLGVDTCAEGLLCAPTVFVEGDYLAAACETSLVSLIFGAAYKPGACLPDCLPAVGNFLLGQDGCAAGYKCAPCLDPLTQQPTRACDYLAPAP